MKKAIGLLKKYAPPALYIAALFLIDQLVKNWAVAALSQNRITIIEDVFYLTFATNDGAAWSILSGARGLLLAVTAVAFGLIFYIFKSGLITTVFGRWTMYTVLGGALGNLYDRAFRESGLVIDMFDFRLINFPIFNVADIFITVGGALFIVHFVWTNLLVKPEDKPVTEDEHDPN